MYKLKQQRKTISVREIKIERGKERKGSERKKERKRRRRKKEKENEREKRKRDCNK